MSSQGATILSIEDDSAMRRIVAGYLRARGYRVLEAEDGRIGLDLFRRERPDVVLLDLRLPAIDGLELLPIFAAESWKTPILVVSGTGMMTDVVEAMRLGAWDFLLKPVADFAALADAIERSRRRAAAMFAGKGSRELLEKEVEVRRDRFEAAISSLQQSENLLKSLVDNSPAAIYVKDTAGRYRMINRKFEEYLSLTMSETLGKTDADLFGDEMAENFMRNDRRVIENGEMITCDEQMAVKGKPSTFLSTKFPMRDAEGNISGVAGISTDISDRKRVEEELLQYREHLEDLVAERTRELAETNEKLHEDIQQRRKVEEALSQANKKLLEEKRSKDLLMAMISHELRTPLHGILSYATFGINNAREDEQNKTKKYFEKIDRSGHELLDMVDDLLDLAKLESGKDELQPAETDVYALVLRELDAFALPASQRRISIHCPTPDQEVRAEVDSRKITQVVRNLLSNALKHSPDGGGIAVSVSQADGHFCISVADQGEGIPEDELDMIFDSFAQSRNKRAGGTGLGLAICREIVSAHQGRIWAGNIPEGGAVFTLRMPLYPFQREELEAETISSSA